MALTAFRSSWPTRELAALALAAMACTASAAADPATATAPSQAASSGEQQLKAAAESTIQRLPTCESTIRTRVSEWQARAAIACRPGAGTANTPACVDAQLKARADQLRRLRSCRFL